MTSDGGWDDWSNLDLSETNDYDSYTPPPLPVFSTNLVDTIKLEKNEISLSTKRACGYINPDNNVNRSLTRMLQQRETGTAFNNRQECKIANLFLPNAMTSVAHYNSRAFCGKYSDDGKLLVTAGQDNILHLYNTEGGDFHEVKTIDAQNVSWSILDTAFSPDGQYIAYSSWSEVLSLCPINGDSTVQESLFLTPAYMGRFCIFSLVFSSDSKEILGSANNGCLYIYDRECHQSKIIKGHSNDVNSVAFADNTSQILYSGSDDGLCKVWDRRTLNEADPREVGILAGHMDGITFVDSRGDGRYLLTNSKDQSIKLWDIRAFSNEEGEMNTRKAVANQDWDYRWQNPVHKQIYESGRMLEGDTSVMTYRGHSVIRTLVRCHFSPAATTGQRYIYTGCGQGKIIIYDLLTGEIVESLHGHKDCVRDVSWHPYHQEIISASFDGAIGCWRYLKTTPSNSIDECS